jgi:hypothetical protein
VTARSLTFVIGIALAGAPAAHAWDFRTKDGSIYCGIEPSSATFGFRCVRPRDGRWASFRGDVFRRAHVESGRNIRFRSVRERRAFTLVRGRAWTSSDAAGVTCWHFRRGVTCKAFEGASFWLGGTSGIRIFHDKLGFRPHVQPLFRTSFVWCGIELDTLEPSLPVLRCWRPRDGREVTLAYPGHAATRVWPKSAGYRPRRFPMLAASATAAWRCRRITMTFADACSVGRGTAVFTCRNGGGGVVCRNRGGRQFAIRPQTVELR